MMKPNLRVALIASMLGLTSSLSYAEDYSSYSNEQLIQLRSEVSYMNDSDYSAYRSEMQTRMQSMDSSERDAMRSMAGSESGKGDTTRTRARDGSGGGQYGGSGGGGGRR